MIVLTEYRILKALNKILFLVKNYFVGKKCANIFIGFNNFGSNIKWALIITIKHHFYIKYDDFSDLFVKLEDFEGLLTLHALQGKSNQSRLKIAFLIAEKEFGIYPLLDPEDVDVSNPDEKSVMTYVAQFLNKFSSKVCMSVKSHEGRK